MKKYNLFLVILFSLSFVISSCVEQSTQNVPVLAAEETLQTPNNPSGIVYDDPTAKASFETNYVVIFDASGSMKWECMDDAGRKIDVAKESFIAFANNNIPADANVALIGLGQGKDDATIILPMAPFKRDEFIKKVRSLSPSGTTPISRCLEKAVAILNERNKMQQGYGDYRILLLTDGAADNPGQMAKECQEILQKYRHISIYSIGFCLDSSHALKDYSLKYFDAEDETELKKALESISAEMSFDDMDFSKFN